MEIFYEYTFHQELHFIQLIYVPGEKKEDFFFINSFIMILYLRIFFFLLYFDESYLYSCQTFPRYIIQECVL